MKNLNMSFYTLISNEGMITYIFPNYEKENVYAMLELFVCC